MAIFALGLDLWLRSRNDAKRAQIEVMGGEEKAELGDTVEERLKLGTSICVLCKLCRFVKGTSRSGKSYGIITEWNNPSEPIHSTFF